MRADTGALRRGARRALVAGALLAGAWSASGPAAFAEQPKPAASPIYGVT
ncbi:cytochrome C oxidase subunit III, partial [Burkholderia diffusa]